MEKYDMIKEIGRGAFGCVFQARDNQSGEVVAIKRLNRKFESWEECLNLREVKSLQKMHHSNIVKIKEITQENNFLYFVFEYMECNLHQLMRIRTNTKPFSETEIRNWCFQVFNGLAHMHARGYFHRDLKPDNLLVSGNIIKIADFGLAREINTSPPYSEYVGTRWYRAPEILLAAPIYGPAVDMWAMGAIMAELLTQDPLFAGVNQQHQMYRICSVMGTPTEVDWAYGIELATDINYQFPQLSGVSLSLLMPSASDDAVSLIRSLCSWDPCKRPTALEALQHPFFRSCYYVPPALRFKTAGVGMNPSARSERSLKHEYLSRFSGTLTNSGSIACAR
ncbi:MAPK related serine/threonine protein kinase [Heracleum sosnowskyi]|uniref:MAPK related serine/threonine protein kinase n=1 Tax=Heracleum sosnowskyi TaxID=360622 RepID=A0AAD8I4X6_9APIA|nr:MAPK related serine/threonine protein kinase [Heracleum sosnowskyi]